MNLRHIDPRSSDWKDAMMEGEEEGKAVGRRRMTPAAGAAVQAVQATFSVTDMSLDDTTSPGGDVDT